MFNNLMCTVRVNLRIAAFRSQHIKSMESQFHTNTTRYAVKKTTSAAGGVLGLGRGKKKVGKVSTMEKKELPIETDPEKLVSYVCGSNIYITGEDVKIKEDTEYPEWLWTLNTGAAPRIEDLDPDTKQYWKRVRAAGPGPGAYRLPTTVGFPEHDPSRNRSPMYSFGMAPGARRRQLGPGPAYRIDRVTRDGLVSAPAWSFGGRLAGRGPQRVPGPGAHAPERCPPTREPRAPQYSMGARLGFALKRPGPAANAYALRLGPGGPAYTMGARVGFSLKARSPGPAVYFQRDADVYRTRAPLYSLAARSEGGGRGARTPGPAAYPPNLYNTKKNPYAYSFGTKHGDYAPPMIIKEDTMDCL